MQFQEKVIIQIQENGEELHFGPNLGTLNSNLDAKIFLFKNMAFSGTRYNGKLSSRTISEKSNDPILGKFSHRPKDAVRRTSSVQSMWVQGILVLIHVNFSNQFGGNSNGISKM